MGGGTGAEAGAVTEAAALGLRTNGIKLLYIHELSKTHRRDRLFMNKRLSLFCYSTMMGILADGQNTGFDFGLTQGHPEEKRSWPAVP